MAITPGGFASQYSEVVALVFSFYLLYIVHRSNR